MPPESSYILNDDTFLFGSLSKTRIPLPLINVVCKAMAPLKKNRYQSVREIDNELSKMNVDERAALLSLNVVSDNVNGSFQNTPYTSGTPYGRRTPTGTPHTPPPYRGHTPTGTPHTPPPPYQGHTPTGKPQTPPPPPPPNGGQGPQISRLVSGGVQQKPPMQKDGEHNPKKNSKIKWIILAVVLALLVGTTVLIVMNNSSTPQTHFIETGGDSYYNDDDDYDYAAEDEEYDDYGYNEK